MSAYSGRQRRSNIRGRAVPQTVSQLTGGLSSTSFFTPSRPAVAAPAQTPVEDDTQAVDAAPASAARPSSTPSAPANSSPSPPSAPAATPANPPSSNPTNKPPTPAAAAAAANASAPLPSTLPRTNTSSDPAPHLPTTASNSIVLAGSLLPKNSPSPQLSTSSPQPSSTGQPTRDFSSAPLVRNTLPPNLIEAIVVVALAVVLILGGIFFYCFRVKRRERGLQEPPQDHPRRDDASGLHASSRTSTSHHHLGPSGLNWPIDKKTIKFKKKSDSIISFGPGPEPNYSAAIPPDHHLYSPQYRNEKFDFSDDSFTERTIPYGHSKDTNVYYGTGDDISHIPISYEGKKPPVGRSGRPPTPPPPAPSRPADHSPMRHLTVKKSSPPRRYNRVSKAARKLVPARLVTGVGIGNPRSLNPLPPQY